MTLSLSHDVLRLTLRDPFLISRSDHGGGHAATTLAVELRDDRHPGIVGVGEGYPDSFYGETPETMAAVWPLLLKALGEPSLDDEQELADASRRVQEAIRWNGAAKCALDIALFDLAGKVGGAPVYELLGLSAEIPPTDFSLGIDEPEVVAQRAERVGAFPALKIKVGGPSDLATLRAVRRVYDKPLRVDANTGWTLDAAHEVMPALVDLGVEL